MDAQIPASYSLRVKSVVINWNFPRPVEGGPFHWTKDNLREAQYIFAPLGIKLEVVGDAPDIKPPPPRVNLEDADGLDDLSFQVDAEKKIVPDGEGELHNLLISYRDPDPKTVQVYTVNLLKSGRYGVAFDEAGTGNPRVANSVILGGGIDPEGRAFGERIIRYPRYTGVLAHELVHVLLSSPPGVNDHLDPKVGINRVNLMVPKVPDDDVNPAQVDYPRRIFPEQQQQILRSTLLKKLGQ